MSDLASRLNAAWKSWCQDCEVGNDGPNHPDGFCWRELTRDAAAEIERLRDDRDLEKRWRKDADGAREEALADLAAAQREIAQEAKRADAMQASCMANWDKLQQAERAREGAIAGGAVKAPQDDPIVGHKTFRSHDGGFRHEPLLASEAAELMADVEAANARRAALMPDERAATLMFFEAWLRLKELGWREAQYCPKDGSSFDVIEAGSTGFHRCHYEGTWPSGGWWIAEHGDLFPSHPVLFRERMTADRAVQHEGAGAGTAADPWQAGPHTQVASPPMRPDWTLSRDEVIPGAIPRRQTCPTCGLVYQRVRYEVATGDDCPMCAWVEHQRAEKEREGA